MSQKQKRIFWLVLLAISAFAVFALLSVRARSIAAAVDRTSSVDRQMTNHLSRIVASADAGDSRGESKATNAPEQLNEEPVEVEMTTLRPKGFEPREITRRQGRFLLAINNHTGMSDVLLQLDSLRGKRIHEVRMRKGRINLSQLIDLPPGDYVVSEASHPDWVCRIKLTPR